MRRAAIAATALHVFVRYFALAACAVTCGLFAAHLFDAFVLRAWPA